MDAIATSSYWRPFWVRRAALPAVLLFMIAVFWLRVKAPEVYWQLRAERLVSAALVESMPLQNRMKAQWIHTGACPYRDATTAFAGSTVIERASEGHWYEGLCGIQLNLKTARDTPLSSARLMLVYHGGRWQCLWWKNVTVQSPKSCRDSAPQFRAPKETGA